ncbi:MOSC domain-containing protein [Qipengyuania zhejiangensis]|uniref:MOSC domain-containing protein n=1 Tax=Qipengyuania zhejiangensis TaxID=3077782 RepID=UPI002D78E6EC|nr:MOSC domain-containing protein [Qipengyuania sp. Z2]
MKTEALAVCVGLPQPFNGAEMSAIDKRPVQGKATIRRFGIEGDMVADTVHHGGADMAVHHYARDHYEGWDQWLGGHELLSSPAAFGENVSSRGMTETDVHIGDRFRFGDALLEVSQPRQPCWKIEHRFGAKAMVKRIVQHHNCGWYYRVIEEGEAQAGDVIERVEIGHEMWSVGRLFAKLYDPAHKADIGELREIASLERLCDLWRGRVAQAVEGM